MTRRALTARAVVLALAVPAHGVQAQGGPDVAVAREYFHELTQAAQRAGSALWGVPLVGPTMFVDARTRRLVANAPDGLGVLDREADVWVGVYPDSLPVYNGAAEWSGTRWTLLSWPLPAGRYERLRLMAHEQLHRLQPELGFSGSNPANAHLDTEAARVLLRLEWRALQAALGGAGADRAAGIADALGFRRQRHQRFPAGALEERQLEANEGLAEYTGVRVAVPAPARAGWALRGLDMADARAAGESVVRNFAYASGPAWGVLLDAYAPGWQRNVTDTTDLGALLGSLAGVTAAAAPAEAPYGGAGVRRAESARETERLARMAAFRQRFVEGETLTLPVLEQFSFSFNPNAVVPFGDVGTVYLTAQVRDTWGTLQVAEGGVLFIREDGRVVRLVLPATPIGYTLELAEGWEIAEGTVRRR